MFDWVQTFGSAEQLSFPGDVIVRRSGNIAWSRGVYAAGRTDARYAEVYVASSTGAVLEVQKVNVYGIDRSYLVENQDEQVYFFVAGVNGGSSDGFSYVGVPGKLGVAPEDRTSVQVALRNTIRYTAALTTDAAGSPVFSFPYYGFSFGNQQWTTQRSEPELALFSMKTNQAVNWLRTIAGDGIEIPTGLLSDKLGGMYLSGYTLGSQTAFGPIIGQGTGGFVAKFDKDGNFMWVRQLGFGSQINSLVDHQDGLWGVGTYGSSITLSNKTLVGPGTFIVHMSYDGEIINLTKVLGLPSTQPIAKMRGANLVLAGTFNGALTVGTNQILSKGGKDAFIAEIDATGAPLWVKTLGYIYDDEISGLGVAANGDIYVQGGFNTGLAYDDTFIQGSVSQMSFLAKLRNGFISLPIISSNSPSASVSMGSAVSLSVGVTTEGAVAYQWFFNGHAIPDATNSVYSIPNATLNSEGTYFVVVSNSAGSIRSSAIELIIRGMQNVSVTTVAGTNVRGYVDSTNRDAVRFERPVNLAHWTGGIMVVADEGNQVVRLIDLAGLTTTFAGAPAGGYVDGPALLAKFGSPVSVAVENSLDVLVADAANHVVRRIGAFGLRTVSTIAGNGIQGYRDGLAVEAQFASPNGLALDVEGNIFVADEGNNVVRKIARDRGVSTFAGSGQPGYRDARGSNALFNGPIGLTFDSQRNLYVTERTNHAIRKILPDGSVTTLAGGSGAGFADGQGKQARFNDPAGITVDNLGHIFVVERGNHAVRKVDSQGNVITIAGLGAPGFKDGDRTQAMFNSPEGIMWHPNGSLFISDAQNHSIRRIDVLSATNSDIAELLITLNPALTIFGARGGKYRIEAAEQTKGGVPLNWIEVGVVTLSSEAEQWHDPQPASRRDRLYRAVRVP